MHGVLVFDSPLAFVKLLAHAGHRQQKVCGTHTAN